MITLTVNGEDLEVPSSASDVNWAANQVAWEQAVTTYLNEAGADAAAAAAEPTWVTIGDPDLQNGWAATNYTPKRTKDVSGWVTLRISVDSGLSGTVFYTLPVGWRPPVPQSFLCVSGVFTAKAVVNTDGTIQLVAGNGADVTADGVELNLRFSTVA